MKSPWVELIQNLLWLLRHWCETRTEKQRRQKVRGLVRAVAEGDTVAIDKYLDELPAGDPVTPADVDGAGGM